MRCCWFYIFEAHKFFILTGQEFSAGLTLPSNPTEQAVAVMVPGLRDSAATLEVFSELMSEAEGPSPITFSSAMVPVPEAKNPGFSKNTVLVWARLLHLLGLTSRHRHSTGFGPGKWDTGADPD